MTYLWSDAWILQAIVEATTSGPIDLIDLIAAADAVNHALPTDDELRGAMRRLVDGGYVQDDGGKFRLTPKVPESVVKAIRVGGADAGRQAAENLLNSEPWTAMRNTGDSRNSVEYPGLTDDILRHANREYDRRRRDAFKRKRDGPAS